MPALFVTATGTDIGKTYLTAGLARHLRELGRQVAVLKPVASGFDPKNFASSDAAVLLEAAGRKVTLEAIAAISPWRFSAPVSPDMAARCEGRPINFAALVSCCRGAIKGAEDVLLIEGIGGLMVPFGSGATVLDLIDSLRIPLILVAGTYVGSLSHTLCAYEALRLRGLNANILVLSESPGSAASPEATRASLRESCPAADILILKRAPAPTNAEIFAQLVRLALPS